MAGAYTLSRGGHVRADMFSRMWPVRVQAGIELSLYIAFFFPGILSMSIAGWHYAYDSFRIKEMSINSPIGIPIWQIKMMIPIGAALLSLQGLAEVCRCILALRENEWPARLHDVEELEQQLIKDKALQRAVAAGGTLP
jgi:TRAP-type mannitol/chloroaromatic compound transport system permease small subunit